MPYEFLYRNCRVVIGFELVDQRQYRGVAIISFDEHGQQLTHEIRPDEIDKDWGRAGRRVELLARDWIDRKWG